MANPGIRSIEITLDDDTVLSGTYDGSYVIWDTNGTQTHQRGIDPGNLMHILKLEDGSDLTLREYVVFMKVDPEDLRPVPDKEN